MGAVAVVAEPAAEAVPGPRCQVSLPDADALAKLPRARWPQPGEARGGGGFRIILNPGPALQAHAQALPAWERAVEVLESLITDPVTVRIDAFLPSMGSGILGMTVPELFQVAFPDVRATMIADAGTDESALLNGLPTFAQYEALVPAGYAKALEMTVTSANCRALGLVCDVDTDAVISLNGDFLYDFDPSDGTEAGHFDFVSLALHEMMHALGFVSIVDPVDASLVFNEPPFPIPATPLDMFRLAPGDGADDFTGNQRLLAPGRLTPDHAFFDGAVDLRFSEGSFFGDGRQASHWQDDTLAGGLLLGVMDPIFERGVGPEFSAADIRALDLIGWDLQSTVSLDCNGNGPPDDCNGNGIPDECDIAGGTSPDANGNGIPDECEKGACCFSGGDCVDDAPPPICEEFGGVYQGDDVLCATVFCSLCGDGAVQGAEHCDDGNTANGDGCDQFCRLEGACCFPNGVCVDNAWREHCENVGALYAGGGTSCQVAACPECGNGAVEIGEECDDGNASGGDGCDERCRLEGACCFSSGGCADNASESLCVKFGGAYQGGGTLCATVFCSLCGDGAVQGAERCDDGNTANGDGCDQFCRLEGACCFPIGICVDNAWREHCENAGASYRGGGTSCEMDPCFSCGNGVVGIGEECDDGNTFGNDGCDEHCQLEGACCFPSGDCVDNAGEMVCEKFGGAYQGDGVSCSTVFCSLCGDGVVEGTEECDDGNLRNRDGCDQFCRLEGACCFPNGICMDNSWREQCESVGAVYQGGGTTCAASSCNK